MIVGKQSILFEENVYIEETACVAGQKESEGPLGKLFDVVVEVSAMTSVFMRFYASFFFMDAKIFFSILETCTCEIPSFAAISVCVRSSK